MTPNFSLDQAMINMLPMWVCFPILPMEYYNAKLLEHGVNMIGKMLKVDDNTLMASRGNFSRMHVEVDSSKPLRAGYRLQGRFWKVQYKGLHDLCFHYGRYGLRLTNCSLTMPKLKGGDVGMEIVE